jgi:tetratricopeptide (TPR) repeat protein
MSATASGRTWDDAWSPAADRLAGRYEAAWRAAVYPRPDLAAYLPDDPEERPGALLALLRTDLTLRWEANEPVAVEWYRRRYEGIDGQVLAGLLLEEFCLRVEAGEQPDPVEYEARFPEVADQVRTLLDIHRLIDEVPLTQTFLGEPADSLLPEAGQTIGGFHLVEELGRGTFARVFRAAERQLGDRPVALKVARVGSREPQTLARLQHTHIVPIYSYQSDRATGLHLLCMPYFGRVTLAQILAAPGIKAARTGAELVAALEQLEPSKEAGDRTAAGRKALAGRPFARAIAWWGARLAEALQHAHDRGILHRDIKPTNVLVTGDGMPMLLDFNLAQRTYLDTADVEPAKLGGTLDYMAPEHLEAVAERVDGRVDNRADVYSLGVVLFEAALDAVVRRCLAPDPSNRYASAAELATDLQAVADDGPLRFAREPQPSRTLRWLRRNRLRFAMAAPIVLALFLLAATISNARVDRFRQEAKVQRLLLEGRTFLEKGKTSADKSLFDRAKDKFAEAAREAGGYPKLRDLYLQACEQGALADEALKVRNPADELFDHAEGLRIDEDSDLTTASRDLEQLLAPFYVLQNPHWTERSELTLLDDVRRRRLPVEVNELLFLWVVALEKARASDPDVARWAVRVCDVALDFAQPRGPWLALRARCTASAEGASMAEAPAPDRPEAETSARACFLWGVLCQRDGDLDRAIAWLERATRLEPDAFWPHFYLGYCHALAGHPAEALEHDNSAVTLHPDSSWARFNRAQLYRARGEWDRALEDLNQALAHEAALGTTFLKAHLELGLVRQALGDFAGARTAFEEVIVAGAGSPDLLRVARVNRASLDAIAGAEDRARDEYNTLRRDDPDDPDAALGLALLALKQGHPEEAEANVGLVLKGRPHSAHALALRARARLALGRPDEAEADAAQARQLDPRPAHARLWTRVLLALGRVEELRLDHPDDLAALPARGPALVADLRRAADGLRAATDVSSRLTRAVLLSALDDPEAAAEASRAVALSPSATTALLVRARVLRRGGDRAGALVDVQRGLDLDPGDTRFWELRGVLQVEGGRAEAGLADLDQAMLLGAEGPSVRGARARALAVLGRDRAARDAWSRVLTLDPEDASAYLGRARAGLRLGRIDPALADLEQAAVWGDDRAGLLARVAASYACCLPERPDRLPRVVALARHAGSLAMGTGAPRSR